MNKKVIIITGAVGFLGSSITIGLSRDHEIIAIDLRKPGNALIEAAPGVKWEQLDIAETKEVAESFLRIKSGYGRIDFVLHFAAFCHFGNKWLPEFDRTNIQGTINISQAAINAGVRRLIFASSISAMEPPLPGQMLTEKTPTSSYIPYAKSKAIGENIIAKGVDKLPCIVLRMGGVFCDWCELPPLYSLIRMWSGHGPLSRIIPGRGESGFLIFTALISFKSLSAASNYTKSLILLRFFLYPNQVRFCIKNCFLLSGKHLVNVCL